MHLFNVPVLLCAVAGFVVGYLAVLVTMLFKLHPFIRSLIRVLIYTALGVVASAWLGGISSSTAAAIGTCLGTLVHLRQGPGLDLAIVQRNSLISGVIVFIGGILPILIAK